MIISLADKETVKKHESKFVSLKYIDLLGNLSQIDIHSRYFTSRDIIELPCKPLRIISNKAFFDPFRSFPTTSFLCETLEGNFNVRTNANRILKSRKADSYQNIRAFIHFWVEDKEQKDSLINSGSNLFIADPADKYANLRSDIIECLENIGIETVAHYHGLDYGEGIIGIGSEGALDLADNLILSKFIITNAAYNYGKNVKFDSKGKNNLEIYINHDKNLNNEFALDLLQNNSTVIKNLFKSPSDDLLNISSQGSDERINLKILLETGKVFNPYLAIIVLIGYASLQGFSPDQLVDESVFNNYVDAKLTN